MIPNKIGFIGLGHIGGSIAKTIHRIYPDIQMIAYDTCRETLSRALSEGVISRACSSVSGEFSDCDYIYLCAPVLNNTDYVTLLSDLLHDDMLLTDVGSVKTGIHEQIQKFPELEKHFIGGHPMCGTEHTGYEYSTAYMLENAYYILTPTRTVPTEKAAEFEAFVASIGALPITLDFQEHDFIVGSVSHLPHVISATLVNLVKELDNEEETMRTIAAGGFKDITRISSSSPVMWENICLANRDTILKLIDIYVASIGKIRQKIADADGSDINSFFRSAKDYRDSFNIPHAGAIKPVYLLFCDLIDEAGGIATIATILAANNISIKNIGIIHNREYQQGVLQIEFYDKDAYEKAVALLRKYHYTVYEK